MLIDKGLRTFFISRFLELDNKWTKNKDNVYFLKPLTDLFKMKIENRFLNWKGLPVSFLEIWIGILSFLNFESSTSHFLNNAKISLVFLIGPFLIRPDWV